MSEERIWRSLAEREGAPDPDGFRHGEFPAGADLPPDILTRRQMLGLMGASLSLAGLAGCRRPEEHIVPYADAPESVMPGVPKTYATTMPAGTSAYGVLVESHEGRPTKIEGNELHPATRGGSSPRLQAAILDLYDPDRSRGVLAHGEASAWDKFVAAWKDLAQAHEADQGAGLAVVSEPFASPTLFRLASAFRQKYPQAKWIAWTAASDVNQQEGLARAAARPVLPVHHLEKAKAILALDSDFLLGDAEMVRHNRGFAAGRRDPAAMNRLWSVEGVFTNTGATADHRLRLPTRQIPAFVGALIGELGKQGLSLAAPAIAAPAGASGAFLAALAKDLLANRGASLVVAGRRQPPSVHAAAAALNAALGNVGQTVTYHEPVDALLPARGELAALVGAMKAGAIKTLVVMGPNPAYSAPADLGFVEAAAKVASLIHLGMHVDETARLAAWHVPAAHFLEAWGDARAAGGTLSVVQPLILPLLGGKSAIEVANLLATGEEKPAYDLVRETWMPRLGNDEGRWRRLLHDGLLADSDLPPTTPAALSLDDLARDAQARGGDLELVFQPCPKVGDGRGTNNAWLHEVPDPMTKVVWDNPLLLSPATAARLGLTDGDLVKVDCGGRALEMSVFRLPGMADGTLQATLGYGRRQGGRVASGVGYDVYPLRTEAAPDLAPSVTVSATGARVLLSQTQEHGYMHPTDVAGEDRPIVRQATVEEFRKDPKFATEDKVENPPLFNLWTDHAYDQGHQWGMAIDLNTCTGCNACAVACYSENNVPVVGKEQVRRGREMAWIRVDRYFTGEDQGDPGAAFQPVPCMQCENAPCEQVCPVAATVHDHEGLNVMVYNRCIGTRYCSNNCPYKVRRFNFFNYTKDTPEMLKMAMNPDVTVRSRGVMEKCTYCVQRLNRGKQEAKLAGRDLADGDVKTACQQACPAQAITFGDLRDPRARVVADKQDPRNYSLLADLNTRPRTTYLARLRNPHPDLAGKEPHRG